MKFRRHLAILMGAIGFAVALMYPAPKPGFVMADVGAPMQLVIPARAESTPEGDETVMALRRQANTALINLKAIGVRR